ncbi:PQQ-binding-like beta-propeller repeat protein [Streptomyces gramineus]|uniref:outer membrane protein assembly factor BamB family protein n=1 Tax=Streptomyces gramineus TaxID=910542 RepID=UPI00398B41B5
MPARRYGASHAAGPSCWAPRGQPWAGGVAEAVNLTSGTQSDPDTWRLRWRFDAANALSAAPTIADDVVYVGSGDNNPNAIDAATGSRKWAYETGDEVWGGPAVSGGVVYIGSFDHRLYALDAATGTKRWSYETNFQISSSPVVAHSTVFACSSDQYVYALDTSARKPAE